MFVQQLDRFKRQVHTDGHILGGLEPMMNKLL
jgi:hypothetical protein